MFRQFFAFSQSVCLQATDKDVGSGELVLFQTQLLKSWPSFEISVSQNIAPPAILDVIDRFGVSKPIQTGRAS